MEPSERMKTLASSKIGAMKEKLSEKAEQAGSLVIADQDVVDAILRDWPAAPKHVAQDAIQHYGPPNEASYSHFIWYDNGPWKRTIVTRDEIPHNFPTPHTDFIMQFIDYRVPPQRISDIALFDGSVIVDRTAGEVAARCDMEAMNFLSLNLLNDIVTDKLSIEQARNVYAEQAAAYMMNRPAPYTERLMFDVTHGGTADLDESIISDAMLHQAKEKIKDAFRRDETKH
jgi:hypothetical protein